jgi:hypothetical protein
VISQPFVEGSFFGKYFLKKFSFLCKKPKKHSKHQFYNKNNFKIEEKYRSQFGNNSSLKCDVGHRIGIIFMV